MNLNETTKQTTERKETNMKTFIIENQKYFAERTINPSCRYSAQWWISTSIENFDEGICLLLPSSLKTLKAIKIYLANNSKGIN